jgi:hypothetical protein
MSTLVCSLLQIQTWSSDTHYCSLIINATSSIASHTTKTNNGQVCSTSDTWHRTTLTSSRPAWLAPFIADDDDDSQHKTIDRTRSLRVFLWYKWGAPGGGIAGPYDCGSFLALCTRSTKWKRKIGLNFKYEWLIYLNNNYRRYSVVWVLRIKYLFFCTLSPTIELPKPSHIYLPILIFQRRISCYNSEIPVTYIPGRLLPDSSIWYATKLKSDSILLLKTTERSRTQRNTIRDRQTLSIERRQIE